MGLGHDTGIPWRNLARLRLLLLRPACAATSEARQQASQRIIAKRKSAKRIKQRVHFRMRKPLQRRPKTELAARSAVLAAWVRELTDLRGPAGMRGGRRAVSRAKSAASAAAAGDTRATSPPRAFPRPAALLAEPHAPDPASPPPPGRNHAQLAGKGAVPRAPRLLSPGCGPRAQLSAQFRRMYARTCAHTHRHADTQTRGHTDTVADTNTDTQTRAHTHTRTRARTHARPQTHKLVNKWHNYKCRKP